MATDNIITTPPLLPVKHLSGVVTAPPKPPALPGIAPHQELVIESPKLPSAGKTKTLAESGKKDLARRQTAVTDGTNDPVSTAEMLKVIGKNSAKTIPVLVKKYWWVALIIVAVWVLIMIWNPMAYRFSHPQLTGLINAVDPVVTFLAFLTSAYNNWFAKSIYVIVVLKVFVPLVRRIRREGFKAVVNSFASVYPDTKSNIVQCGMSGLPVFISLLGLGLIFSNFLTRNNDLRTALISLTLAISLVKVLSDGTGGVLFMATRVISKDLFKVIKKENPVKDTHIYVGIAGLTTGFLGVLVLLIFARLPQGNNMGYFIGAFGFLTGFGLYFYNVWKTQKNENTAG